MIKCHNLSKRYGRLEALKPTQLELEAGSPIALIGPNGAGKTTFISLLCGFTKASSGHAELFGHPLGSMALHNRLSCLPQDALLDPSLSLGEQLSFLARLQGFSKASARAEATRVLELVDLASSFDKKPRELSHGMAKRGMIAQAFIGDPELIILDEPTAGIDPANARLIRELILSQSEKRTFMVSSHNIAELENICGRVLYIEKGELSAMDMRGERLGTGDGAPSESDAISGETIIGQTPSEDTSNPQATPRLANLGLHLSFPDQGQTLDHLRSLPGFAQASYKGSQQLHIEYQADVKDFDQQLLALLANQGIEYRQLNKGKSLEEILFS